MQIFAMFSAKYIPFESTIGKRSNQNAARAPFSDTRALFWTGRCLPYCQYAIQRSTFSTFPFGVRMRYVPAGMLCNDISPLPAATILPVAEKTIRLILLAL